MGCPRLTYKNENFLKVAYSKKEETASKIALDYFSGGMPMPNRQIVGGELYRYGYQGEYAETDDETGKVAFELRLYDTRINRWLTPDPYGEFYSPYLAMGNNWMNTVDPDGGCTTCPDDAKQGDTFNHPEFGEMQYDEFLGWNISGTSMLDTVIIGGGSSGDFNPIMFQPIPIGLTGGFTTLAEIKSFFTANSGSTMYGNGSDNQMSRKGSGEIYGTWDFNEMVIPGGGGGQMKFWLHKQNLGKHFIRGVQTGTGAVDQYNTLEPIISPSTSSDITKSVTVKQFSIHLDTRTIDSTDITRTFNGTEIDVNRKIDSTINNSNIQRRSANSWFDN